LEVSRKTQYYDSIYIGVISNSPGQLLACVNRYG